MIYDLCAFWPFSPPREVLDFISTLPPDACLTRQCLRASVLRHELSDLRRRAECCAGRLSRAKAQALVHDVGTAAEALVCVAMPVLCELARACRCRLASTNMEDSDRDSLCRADPDYWIIESGLPMFSGSVVVTDCRYQNELDCIRQMGGRTVFVQDMDADHSPQRHCSEHLIVLDFDYSLCNCKRRPELTIARLLHLCDRMGLPTSRASRRGGGICLSRTNLCSIT